MASVIAEGDAFVRAYEQGVRAGEPRWLRERRREAFERYGSIGLPTPRHEDWQHTNLAPIAKANLRPVSETGLPYVPASPFAGLPGAQRVFVDGRLAGGPSDDADLPAGVRIHDLNASLARDGTLAEAHLGKCARFADHPFAALNMALFTDGAVIHIAEGVQLDEPLHLHFASSAVAREEDAVPMAHPRILLVAEAGCRATILESHTGPDGRPYLTNAHVEILVGEGAQVEHVKLQAEGDRAWHFSTFQVELGDAARFASHVVLLGAELIRNDVKAWLGGEGVHCTLNGVYVLSGEQKCDTWMWVDHAAPNGESHELYKGILDDRSTGSFRGRIHVHRGAQKTDAKQTNQNVLLSAGARARSDPQLEIYADDVKCTHASTIGRLDPDALFYLRTRGIPASAARGLLVRAVVGEVISRIGSAPVRERLDAILRAHLSAIAK